MEKNEARTLFEAIEAVKAFIGETDEDRAELPMFSVRLAAKVHKGGPDRGKRIYKVVVWTNPDVGDVADLTIPITAAKELGAPTRLENNAVVIG